MVSTWSRARDLEVGEDAGVSKDEGFRAMYEAEFVNVYRTVLLMCGDRSIAEEATQEAFARALARWRRLSRTSWAADDNDDGYQRRSAPASASSDYPRAADR